MRTVNPVLGPGAAKIRVMTALGVREFWVTTIAGTTGVVFTPQPDAVVIAGDKEPSLRTRLLICQSCVMDKPLDIPILLERVNACRVSEADRG